MWGWETLQAYKQDTRKINPLFFKLKQIAQVGDLIVIDSDNFMSSLFKQLDKCYYSSFKIVVQYNDEKMIMVSDIDNLSDDEGFYISEMEGFFSDYDQVRISLWHPNFLTPAILEKIEYMKQIALQNKIAYDFAYNFRSSKGMSCIKMIQQAYGTKIFDTKNFNKAPFYNPLMCDVKLEKFFTKKIDFFPFWINP